VSRRDAPAALRWTVYVAVAIVFAIACAFLSNWQFARNEERAAQLALVEANYDAEPRPLGEVLAPSAELAASDEWTPVVLEGEYLPEDQVLVRNRPHGGTSAFEVLVPLRTEDGRVILVDRGWVAPGDAGPEPDAVPAPPSAEVSVVVRLRPGEPAPTSGRSAPDGQVPTINLPLVADQMAAGVELETGAYGLLVSETPAPATAPSAVEAPTADAGPHLSYAVQWILFAVMGFVFIVYVIVTERRHRREELADAAAAASAPSPVDAAGRGDLPPAVAAHRRRTRVRDRDADAEDALLDRTSS
jgi:cytochrome oxidase assembly protein ShyY1